MAVRKRRRVSGRMPDRRLSPPSTVAHTLRFSNSLDRITTRRKYSQHDARIFWPPKGGPRAVQAVSPGTITAVGTTSTELNIPQSPPDGAHQTTHDAGQVPSICTLYIQKSGRERVVARRCRDRALNTQGPAAGRDIRGRQGAGLLGQRGDASMGVDKGRAVGTSHTTGVEYAQYATHPAIKVVRGYIIPGCYCDLFSGSV